MDLSTSACAGKVIIKDERRISHAPAWRSAARLGASLGKTSIHSVPACPWLSRRYGPLLIKKSMAKALILATTT